MSEPTAAFTELLARARQGDDQALQELVQEYEPEIRMVARRRLGPALRPYLDTLDVVQSVHKSLLLGLRQDRFDLSSPDKLVGLALVMVRRKVAHHWRHLQRQKRLEGGGPSGDVPDLLVSLSSAEPDPARAAAVNDELRQLYAGLGPAERQMLEMSMQGFSTKEIADELGLDLNVLRVRMTRLRQRLRGAGVTADWL